MADAISLADWGRIYAFLFWLKKSSSQADQDKYDELKQQCEQDPKTALEVINEEMTDRGAPEIEIPHGKLFDHYVPEDLRPEQLEAIARNGCRHFGVVMRLSC